MTSSSDNRQKGKKSAFSTPATLRRQMVTSPSSGKSSPSPPPNEPMIPRPPSRSLTSTPLSFSSGRQTPVADLESSNAEEVYPIDSDNFEDVRTIIEKWIQDNCFENKKGLWQPIWGQKFTTGLRSSGTASPEDGIRNLGRVIGYEFIPDDKPKEDRIGMYRLDWDIKKGKHFNAEVTLKSKRLWIKKYYAYRFGDLENDLVAESGKTKPIGEIAVINQLNIFTADALRENQKMIPEEAVKILHHFSMDSSLTKPYFQEMGVLLRDLIQCAYSVISTSNDFKPDTEMSLDKLNGLITEYLYEIWFAPTMTFLSEIDPKKNIQDDMIIDNKILELFLKECSYASGNDPHCEYVKHKIGEIVQLVDIKALRTFLTYVEPLIQESDLTNINAVFAELTGNQKEMFFAQLQEKDSPPRKLGISK